MVIKKKMIEVNDLGDGDFECVVYKPRSLSVANYQMLFEFLRSRFNFSYFQDQEYGEFFSWGFNRTMNRKLTKMQFDRYVKELRMLVATLN